MRVKFTYRCSKCKMENYIDKKNKTEHPDKMEVMKFCARCNTRTKHIEKK